MLVSFPAHIVEHTHLVLHLHAALAKQLVRKVRHQYVIFRYPLSWWNTWKWPYRVKTPPVLVHGRKYCNIQSFPLSFDLRNLCDLPFVTAWALVWDVGELNNGKRNESMNGSRIWLTSSGTKNQAVLKAALLIVLQLLSHSHIHCIFPPTTWNCLKAYYYM